MNRAGRIESIIKETFPGWQQFSLEDESHQHAGRKGMESHFKLLLVSESFSNKSRVQRHREVQSLLEKEFEIGLHALTLRLLTPQEFDEQSSEFQSPNCQGNKK